jgi:hypothetical protein
VPSTAESEPVHEPAAPKRQRQKLGYKPDIQTEKIIAVLDACPNQYFRVPVLLEILETYADYLKPNAPTEKVRRAANLSAFLGRRSDEQNISKHSWNRLRDPDFTHGVRYLFYSKHSTLALKAGSMESFKAGLEQALASQAQQLEGCSTPSQRCADQEAGKHIYVTNMGTETALLGGALVPKSIDRTLETGFIGMPLLAALPASSRPLLMTDNKSTSMQGNKSKSTQSEKSMQGDEDLRLSKEEADEILDCFLTEDDPMNQAPILPVVVAPADMLIKADCAAHTDFSAHADFIAQNAMAGVAALVQDGALAESCTSAASAESCTRAAVTARVQDFLQFSNIQNADMRAGSYDGAAHVDFRACQSVDGLLTGMVRF